MFLITGIYVAPFLTLCLIEFVLVHVPVGWPSYCIAETAPPCSFIGSRDYTSKHFTFPFYSFIKRGKLQLSGWARLYTSSLIFIEKKKQKNRTDILSVCTEVCVFQLIKILWILYLWIHKYAKWLFFSRVWKVQGEENANTYTEHTRCKLSSAVAAITTVSRRQSQDGAM